MSCNGFPTLLPRLCIYTHARMPMRVPQDHWRQHECYRMTQRLCERLLFLFVLLAWSRRIGGTRGCACSSLGRHKDSCTLDGLGGSEPFVGGLGGDATLPESLDPRAVRRAQDEASQFAESPRECPPAVFGKRFVRGISSFAMSARSTPISRASSSSL